MVWHLRLFRKKNSNQYTYHETTPFYLREMASFLSKRDMWEALFLDDTVFGVTVGTISSSLASSSILQLGLSDRFLTVPRK